MPKVNVVSIPGSSEILGKIDAQMGMNTTLGMITAVRGSGDVVLVGSGATQGRFEIIADQLFLPSGEAITTWNYPNSYSSVKSTRADAFSSTGRTPTCMGSGSAFQDGTNTINRFGR